MAERDERAPTAPGDPPADGTPVDDTPAGGVTVGDPPDGRDSRTPPAGTPGPDDFSGLLATLGHYLDRHSPDEVMVLLRAELERREIRAYADGWRDAAARYEPALEEARAASGRTLRLVRRVPGQAAVIPLRQDAQDAGDAQGVRDGAEPAAPRTGKGLRRDGAGGGSTPERTDTADEASGDGPADSSPGVPPALVPKSRTSRVPTIPRLRTTLRRPSSGGGRTVPDGGAL